MRNKTKNLFGSKRFCCFCKFCTHIKIDNSAQPCGYCKDPVSLGLFIWKFEPDISIDEVS